MISTKGFKAYDIRGVVPSDVNEELAYALGRSLAFYLKAKTLVIGHDIRLSGPSLRDAAVRGMRDTRRARAKALSSEFLRGEVCANLCSFLY